ncbi:HigB toxin protein [Rhodovulum sp. PH10]|uniref:type II toxin-antitoxin system RelE/ParE family toxin n=1 Tax=Rhodovulum sp. PH10 TaxID=1187851 RepID=UPI00027C22AE|nr:type II toxin-antitoxin system RelE/ParE family toxin [Rhodovulum sp. PH10]EJW09324.1 HigB toxin protein [Rhodovulum sp. PH10]
MGTACWRFPFLLDVPSGRTPARHDVPFGGTHRRDQEFRRQPHRGGFRGLRRSRSAAANPSSSARQLHTIDAAVRIDDLRVPPGNRLEPLHGDRKGQYSIRINDQWRFCFVWRNGEASDVEIVDYH